LLNGERYISIFFMLVKEMDRRLLFAVPLISLVAFSFLVWLIYFKPVSPTSWTFLPYMPVLNCFLNGLSAVALVLGVRAIKNKQKEIHRRYMISAFVFSTLFLLSYVFYHNFVGDTHFTGVGIVREIYFFILTSHIVMTIFALPLILFSFGFSLMGQFEMHKKVARVTFPIWLYVSVTGVLVYLFLKFL